MIGNMFDRFCASKNIFELNIKYLFLVGLWPKDRWNKDQCFLYKIYQNTLHCFSIIFLITSGIGTYQIKNDLFIFFANIDKSIVAYNYFFKVIFFLINREKLKKLVDEIILSGDQVADDSRSIMVKHLVLITAFNTGLMVVFSMLALHNGEMSVEAWMPFDARKNKMNLTLSAQIVAALFGIPFSYRSIGMQGIICSLLIYLCDQLKTLQDMIRKINYSIENDKETKKTLNKIIVKHIRLMRYSSELKEMFKEYFLIQNLAVTMEICLGAMMVTMVGTDQLYRLVGFLAFVGLALLNAYIYSHLGNDLIDQSEGLAFAAYSSNWTTWPVDMQKSILLIIRAAQRPFQMSAGGVTVISMQSYGTTLYNGYSIFAVLNDMVKK